MTSPVGTPRHAAAARMTQDDIDAGMAGIAASSIGAPPGVYEGNVPLPDSPETAQQEMNLKYLIMNLQAEVSELKKRLEGKQHDTNYEEKLKPIDATDVKKPGEYDGDTKHFLEWYALFKDLLKNKNGTWETIFGAVEEMRSKKVVDYKSQIFESLKEHPKFESMYNQCEVYSQQLMSYLKTYTKGLIHNRLLKSKTEDTYEILREIIFKGGRCNKVKVLNLKSAVLILQEQRS